MAAGIGEKGMPGNRIQEAGGRRQEEELRNTFLVSRFSFARENQRETMNEKRETGLQPKLLVDFRCDLLENLWIGDYVSYSVAVEVVVEGIGGG